MARDDVPAFRARVRTMLGGTIAVLDDGRRVRLQGLSLPTPVVRPVGFARSLRSRLEHLLLDRELLVEVDAPNALDDLGRIDLTATLRVAAGVPSINAQVLGDGLALFACRTEHVAAIAELGAAAQRAQLDRRGWFATTPRARVEQVPYLNGAVVGLHHLDRARSYERELDELAAAGFADVSLIFPTFVRDVAAWRIDRHHPRTVTDERLIATIRHARERCAMRVMLLPIVLIEHAGEDDWRGKLRPDPEAKFWLEYDSMLAHYLDIAEATGVEIFSVGSELGSLEDRTETWGRLIENARGRFSGLLTYSANWDHLHVGEFFDRLDAVGMTAYFSLTELDAPSQAQIEQAWRRVGEELRRSAARLRRPLFFTELGYASQDGINRDPWNYLIARDRHDVAEQRDCFAAALAVVPELEFVSGAYWFEYFGDGGVADSGYTPRGKPAFEIWKRWAAMELDRPIRRAVPR